MKISKIYSWLKSIPIPLLYVNGVLMLIVLGFIDVATGKIPNFMILYALPIIFISWFSQIGLSLLISVIVWVLWMTCSQPTVLAQLAQIPLAEYWNVAMGFIFFSISSVWSHFAGRSFDHEFSMARTDSLTCIANHRALFEIGERELARCIRYSRPISIAYLDIDDFKKINDTFGHQAGDEVLCKVAFALKAHVRETDLAARLGGDEFAVVFTEADYEASEHAIRNLLKHLNKIQIEGNKVTFSVGLVTFPAPEEPFDALISEVDKVMYSVKRSDKDNYRHTTFHISGGSDACASA